MGFSRIGLEYVRLRNRFPDLKPGKFTGRVWNRLGFPVFFLNDLDYGRISKVNFGMVQSWPGLGKFF